MNDDACEHLAVACSKMSSVSGKQGSAAKPYGGRQNRPVFLGQPVNLGVSAGDGGGHLEYT